MKAKFIDFRQLNDLMDTAIRNAEIVAFWMGLGYTNLSYKQKIDTVREHYIISDKLVESIISRSPSEKEHDKVTL